MNRHDCYRVRVKDSRGSVVIDWTASLFSSLTVITEEGKTIIAKRGLIGTETYIPAWNQSVEMRSWINELFRQYRSK